MSKSKFNEPYLKKYEHGIFIRVLDFYKDPIIDIVYKTEVDSIVEIGCVDFEGNIQLNADLYLDWLTDSGETINTMVRWKKCVYALEDGVFYKKIKDKKRPIYNFLTSEAYSITDKNLMLNPNTKKIIIGQ